MKNIYIDLSDFKNTFPVLEALKTYGTLKKKLTLFVKGSADEYTSLDDFKNIVRRNKFADDDINSIEAVIKPIENFENISLNDETITMRLLDDTKTNHRSLFVFYKENDEETRIEEIINKALIIYKKYINNDHDIKLGNIQKFKNDDKKEAIFKKYNEYKGQIPLKNVLSNEFDIVLIDDEASYYLFTLLKNYSKFIKREKTAKSYFAKFSPFGYQKFEEREVDVDTLFSLSYFKIDKNDKLYIYIKEETSPSEFIEIFNLLESISQKI